MQPHVGDDELHCLESALLAELETDHLGLEVDSLYSQMLSELAATVANFIYEHAECQRHNNEATTQSLETRVVDG
jgi:hypothetical protein